MFWYGDAKPAVWSLEILCVKYFAVLDKGAYDSVKKYLCVNTLKQIDELRESIKIFVDKHRCIGVSIDRRWMKVTVHGALDWKNTAINCFKFIEDSEQAFVYAACNALYEECKKLWEEFDEEVQDKLRSHKNGVVHFAVRRILRGRPYSLRKPFQAIAGGWPLAVLNSLQNDNEAFFYTNWIFIFAVNSKNYHMFELLLTPKLFGLYEFSWGWFSKAVNKAKDLPPHWQRRALLILRQYIFASRKPDLNAAELEEIEKAMADVNDALIYLCHTPS